MWVGLLYFLANFTVIVLEQKMTVQFSVSYKITSVLKIDSSLCQIMYTEHTKKNHLMSFIHMKSAVTEILITFLQM